MSLATKDTTPASSSSKTQFQPGNQPPDDGKDWYCIECHLAGDVTACKHCHRVFHAECSQNVRHKQMVFQTIEKHYQFATTLTEPANPVKTLNDTINESLDSNLINNRNKEEKTGDSNNSNVKSETKTGNSKTNYVYDESICSICNLHNLEATCDLPKEELNHLLSFILERIKSWLPSNITHKMAPGQKYEWSDAADLSWRARQLFYRHVDMNVMESKLRAKKYIKLVEFMADVITVQHNVAIFHGIESQEYGAADLMIRDTCHDASEVKTCIDCYQHSNEKINNKWFCFPCRNPHKLVWAKQKGYPFWPAKVIKETETTYDVRFFGGKYERSILPKNKKNVLPIEIKPKNHEVKKSTSFNKALEELKLHQQFLANPSLLKKHLALNLELKKKKPKNTEKRISDNIIKKTVNKKLSAGTSGPDDASHTDQIKKDSQRKPIKRTSTSRESTENKLKRYSSNFSNKSVATKSNVQEVIPISDAEEDEFLSLDNYNIAKSNEGCYGQVSSSTECFISTDDGFHAQEISDVMHPLEQPYSDAVEKMRRKLEQAKEKKQLISTAMDCMQQEIDRIVNEHNEHLKKLFHSHQAQISETKKKQWCYNCEQDAIYHCCWNTAYCSPTCQQQHWQAEHKKVCRRKR